MKLRIAILASNLLPIPPTPGQLPPGYAGAAEMVMWRIAEGMVRQGHDVSLFASGDSKTSAKLVSVTAVASAVDPTIGIEHHREFEHLLISKCYEMAQSNTFDIIHSLFDTQSAYYAHLVKTPTVATLHSPLSGMKKRILEKIPATQWYVSISNAQRLGLRTLRYIDTVYHGIELPAFPFQEEDSGYMMIAGRIMPTKGVLEAVQLAHETKRPLWVLGSHEAGQEAYWKRISSLIDDTVVHWKGMIAHHELGSFYQKAKCFLFPLQWEEPFGLVMIESMACGTPIIAFARGSVPEVVSDGETGFIVNASDSDIRGNWIVKKTGLGGVKEAIEKIYAMPSDEYQAMRRACRARVEKLFTVGRMVENYEQVYTKILSQKS